MLSQETEEKKMREVPRGYKKETQDEGIPAASGVCHCQTRYLNIEYKYEVDSRIDHHILTK